MINHILSNYYLGLDRRVDYYDKMKQCHGSQFLEHHSVIKKNERNKIENNFATNVVVVVDKFTLKSSIRPRNFAVRLY